jgi:hypothetical protein
MFVDVSANPPIARAWLEAVSFLDALAGIFRGDNVGEMVVTTSAH